MMSFLRRHRRGLFVAFVAIFLIGIFVGLGGYFFTGADVSEAVAVVGGRKIPYLQYRTRVNQYLDALRERNTTVTEAMEQEVKVGMLRDMIVDELLASQAEAMGFRISDLELSLAIRNTPAFQRNGQFEQELYFQTVRFAFKMTPEQYERSIRRSMLSSKLKSIIYQSAKLAPGELLAEYRRSHNGSDKNFGKDKDQFAADLRQKLALDAINFYLRQLSTQVDIRSYLEDRERGA